MYVTEIARRIDTAARLLSAVGRAADTTPGAGIHCLVAADHLRVAGADATRGAGAATPGTAEQTIRVALAELAGLPPEVFARDDVLDAADAARTALARAEDGE